VDPIKTWLLEARVVTAGKGGEGGKVLDNLTDTEGLTYRQDHENTQSKYSTLLCYSVRVCFEEPFISDFSL